VFRPFFDKVTVDLPSAPRPLVISAKGAGTKHYIKSYTVNGKNGKTAPVITFGDIVHGGDIVFHMTADPTEAFVSSVKPQNMVSMPLGWMWLILMSAEAGSPAK
jgi:putative alpha-1,2-mannosidase